jgi:peroxiredoxin
MQASAQSCFDSAYQEPVSYALKYSRAFLSFARSDTVYNELTVYCTTVGKQKYFRIIDKDITREYIRDSSGFYVFIPPSQVLTKVNETDTNFLLEHVFSFISTKFLHFFMGNYPYRIDSTELAGYYVFKFDSFESAPVNAPKLKDITTIHAYYNCNKRMVDKLTYHVWSGGLYQYHSDSLVSYVREFPGVYDSIRVDKLLPYLRKKTNTPSLYDSSKVAMKLLLGSTFPDITLRPINGTNLRLYDRKAKIYVIDFHYKACFPCWMLHDELNKLHEKYHSSQVKIIGINHSDKNDKSSKDFYKKKKPLYDVVFSNDVLKKRYKIPAYPTVFILNNKFQIIDIIEGYSEDHVLRIENHIKETVGTQ